MRVSLPRWASSVRLTLFTRASCGLCDVAKSHIAPVVRRRAIDYHEVDIMAPEQQRWRDVYDYDVPVLHIDLVTSGQDNAMAATTTLDAAKKLMHRFSEQEIERAIDQVEEEAAATGP